MAQGSQPRDVPSETVIKERRVGALEKEVEESDDGFHRSPLELLQVGVKLCAERVNSYSLIYLGGLWSFTSFTALLFFPCSFVITGRGTGFIRFRF